MSSQADEAIIDGRYRDSTTLLVHENLRLTRVLRKFVKWFDQIERDTDADDRDSHSFRDLRDLRDEAQRVLMGVSEL